MSVERLSAIEQEIDGHLDINSPGQCLSCPYYSSTKATLRQHIEAKHIDTGGFSCSVCNKICSTRHAFKIHRLRYHN